MRRDSGRRGSAHGVRRGCAAAAALVLATVAGGDAWREPEGFKGLRWGSTPADLQTVLAPGPDCQFILQEPAVPGTVDSRRQTRHGVVL